MQIKTVRLSGHFHFMDNAGSDFKGPIKRGFRPIAWLDNIKDGATSCSVVTDLEVNIGEVAEMEIILLNEHQLPVQLERGTIISIGSIQYKLGTFTVMEHLGIWEGKVP